MRFKSAFIPRQFFVPVLTSSLLIASFTGCHRAPSPDVMATVNGKNIMRADVDKYYKASLGENAQEPSPERAEIVRLNILHELIEDEIIQQRAAKLGLAATDEDVEAKLTEMRAPYTKEEFDQQLKQRNITLDDLKRDIRRSLTREKLQNKEIESKINITDADISNYYTAHKAEFNLIEPRYGLAQIVAAIGPVQQSDGMPSKQVTDADAKKKIQAIYNELRSGADFGGLAMRASDDPNTAPSGGDMGFVFESALHNDPAAYDAISVLKPGEITAPLPVYGNVGPTRRVIGYAIYKLLSREPAGQRELNDPRVQQAIRQTLREGRAQLLKYAYFEVLHDQATVRNFYAEQVLKNGSQ
ncbi:MAG TPA: SurA N-terminal domain-containing protein [Terracidiphilus sp.]|nr:SurA N-terminal domain-containing protein [Terracidiphilus sp.]